MDNSKAGYLLIGTTMVILLVFLVALLMLMVIYRKRKMEHLKEVEAIREKYHKEMLETQIEIQKDTMQQIGREIHDSVGQKLTLASLYTEHIGLDTQATPSKEKIAAVTELIHESLQDLRELSKYLTHSSGTGGRLEMLLQKEADKLQQAEICTIKIESEGKPVELSLKINTMLLRITQEFLHNSIRHSGCKNIRIGILYGDKGFNLCLGDDGNGFTPEALDLHVGIGIENMKKRATIIGAQFSLKSAPGEGTRLDLFIPVENII